MSKLLIIEGTVGSGKSTASRWLMSKLGESDSSIVLHPEPVPISTNHEFVIGKAGVLSFPHPGCDWSNYQGSEIIDSMIDSRMRKARSFVDNSLSDNSTSILDGGLFHRDLDALFCLECPSKQSSDIWLIFLTF